MLSVAGGLQIFISLKKKNKFSTCSLEDIGDTPIMDDEKRYQWWKDKRTFVTRATRVVGRNLVKSLVRYGAEVVVLLRDWLPKDWFLGSWLERGSF
jgi:hypothetical protein